MKTKKILVVDDDEDFLRELSEMLTLSGYAIISAHDSKMVAQLAQSVNPDVILLDLKMNGIDGFEVAQTLKDSSETNHIPIIAMTGYFTSPEYADLIEKYGFRGCLKKPFNPLDLIIRVESILANNKDKDWI